MTTQRKTAPESGLSITRLTEGVAASYGVFAEYVSNDTRKHTRNEIRLRKFIGNEVRSTFFSSSLDAGEPAMLNQIRRTRWQALCDRHGSEKHKRTAKPLNCWLRVLCSKHSPKSIRVNNQC